MCIIKTNFTVILPILGFLKLSHTLCVLHTSETFVLASAHWMRECKFISGEVTCPVGILYSLRFFPVSSSIKVPVRVAAQLLAGRPTCTGKSEMHKH